MHPTGHVCVQGLYSRLWLLADNRSCVCAGPVLPGCGWSGSLQPLPHLYHGPLHHETQGRVQVEEAQELNNTVIRGKNMIHSNNRIFKDPYTIIQYICRRPPVANLFFQPFQIICFSM